MPTSRLEAFSDGVISIVITLLALEFTVPIIMNPISESELLHSLLELIPEFLVFGFSFLVIAIYWSSHHRFFYTISHSTRSLVWNNIILLFWITIIPFPTAIVGSYPKNATAVFFYGFVLFMASISFLWMRYRARHLFIHQLSDDIRHVQAIRSLVGPVCYGLAMIVATTSVYLSYALFVLVPFVYFFPSKTHETIYNLHAEVVE